MRTDHGLVSPEAVPLDLAEATVGSRGAAVLIDWALQGIVVIAVTLSAQSALRSALLPGWVAPTVSLVLTFVVWFGYPIAFETAWSGGGRTPGKAALGLRVVTVEGAPVRFRHAAIRAALGLVDFAATFGLAAVVSSLVSRRHQRLGDLVAGTVVLRERTGAGPSTSRDFAVPPAVVAIADTLDVSGLTARDYGVVRSYLLRADALPDQRRDALGTELLTALAPRLGDVPNGYPSEVLLEAIAARYQQRSRGGGV
ncbi:MAG TPA: RDD family protein, partial [Euzebyales bacterium]|nr:RDD family protein [Euzebyales bacterium]